MATDTITRKQCLEKAWSTFNENLLPRVKTTGLFGEGREAFTLRNEAQAKGHTSLGCMTFEEIESEYGEKGALGTATELIAKLEQELSDLEAVIQEFSETQASDRSPSGEEGVSSGVYCRERLVELKSLKGHYQMMIKHLRDDAIYNFSEARSPSTISTARSLGKGMWGLLPSFSQGSESAEEKKLMSVVVVKEPVYVDVDESSKGSVVSLLGPEVLRKSREISKIAEANLALWKNATLQLHRELYEARLLRKLAERDVREIASKSIDRMILAACTQQLSEEEISTMQSPLDVARQHRSDMEAMKQTVDEVIDGFEHVQQLKSANADQVEHCKQKIRYLTTIGSIISLLYARSGDRIEKLEKQMADHKAFLVQKFGSDHPRLTEAEEQAALEKSRENVRALEEALSQLTLGESAAPTSPGADDIQPLDTMATLQARIDEISAEMKRAQGLLKEAKVKFKALVDEHIAKVAKVDADYHELAAILADLDEDLAPKPIMPDLPLISEGFADPESKLGTIPAVEKEAAAVLVKVQKGREIQLALAAKLEDAKVKQAEARKPLLEELEKRKAEFALQRKEITELEEAINAILTEMGRATNPLEDHGEFVDFSETEPVKLLRQKLEHAPYLARLHASYVESKERHTEEMAREVAEMQHTLNASLPKHLELLGTLSELQRKMLELYAAKKEAVPQAKVYAIPADQTLFEADAEFTSTRVHKLLLTIAGKADIPSRGKEAANHLELRTLHILIRAKVIEFESDQKAIAAEIERLSKKKV